MWDLVGIPANPIYPILCRGLWAADSDADNSRGWNFKGQWKMRWQLLGFSPSAQESALELWVIVVLEKKCQSSSYVDSPISGVAKMRFTFQFF